MNANETGLRDVSTEELQTVEGGGVWNHEESVAQTVSIGESRGRIELQPAMPFKA